MSINESGIHDTNKVVFDAIEESFNLHKVTWQDISRLIDFICLWITAMVTVLSSFLSVVVTKASSNQYFQYFRITSNKTFETWRKQSIFFFSKCSSFLTLHLLLGTPGLI